MKSAQLAEFFEVEQHEHPRREGMMQARKVLEQIIAGIKKFVEPTAALAKDVCGHAMELLALGQFDGAAHDLGMRQFDIGIEKKNVSAVGVGCAKVAAD